MSSGDSVPAGPRNLFTLLLATAGLSLTITVMGQRLLRERQQALTPETSAQELWQTYRWSVDPLRRREAALLMAKSSPTLAGQGWGDDPLAAVALALAAESEQRRGDHSEACLLYTSPSPRDGLLSRMPSSA